LQPLVAFAGGGQEGRLLLTRPLDYESLSKFNVTIRVSDQGNPPLHSDTFVEIKVLDADDQNPRFETNETHLNLKMFLGCCFLILLIYLRFQHVSYSALMPRNPRGGTPLEIEPEPIYAFDQDTGINAPILYSIAQGMSS
jgi:hypothetical protein